MTNTLPKTVRFEDANLQIIDHQGRPWLTGADLARALGYEKTRSVSNLYSRYADEFTDDMALVTNLVIKGYGNGHSPKATRIYSPRGCHLIAMLARTDKAKAFRRWVLDVLEGLEQAPGTGGSRLKKIPMAGATEAEPPSMTGLISCRDAFRRRGNFVVEMENLIRAVKDFPEHTSAELSTILQVHRSDTARLVAQATEDRWIKPAPVRRCAISGRRALTWVARDLVELTLPPKLSDYGFERFIRSCDIPRVKLRAEEAATEA